MRIEDIDISLILPQPGMSNSSHDEEDDYAGSDVFGDQQ